MRKNRRHPFTLLEMMVSLTLLSVLTGFCLWKGGQFVSHHRFTNDVQKLSRMIEELNTIALCQNISIDLVISYKNGKLAYSVESDEVESIFFKKSEGYVDGISHICLINPKGVEEKMGNSINIHFHPLRGITSPSKIAFYFIRHSFEESYIIDLQKGIPFQLQSNVKKELI